MIFVSVGAGLGKNRDRRFVVRFVGLLKKGRTRAMVEGRPVKMLIAPENRSCKLSRDSASLTIPEDLRIEGEGLNINQDGEAEVVFFPDGESTGGEFRILRDQTVLAHFRIDPLTGLVFTMESSGES